MEAFIDGISAISPQKTLTGPGFLQDIQEYNGVRALKCIEPTIMISLIRWLHGA